jgi:hypothetical protein
MPSKHPLRGSIPLARSKFTRKNMAPVVWFLVQHADGDVSVEPKVWEGWTKEAILASFRQFNPPTINLTDEWANAAVLRVDEDEYWTLPF